MINYKGLWHNKEKRNLFVNILVAFIVKGLALMVSLFSMPLYMAYFSNDSVLGFWYTILSVLSWVSICDLGLGSGLRNRLTESLSKEDFNGARCYISSTYFLLSIIIIPVLAIGSVLLAVVDLNSFFQISKEVLSTSTVRNSIIILFVGVGINFVLKSVNSIIYAIQKSSINNVLAFIASSLPLLYILISTPDNSIETNFLVLSIVHILSINLPLLVATFLVFLKKELKLCRPSFKSIDFTVAKNTVTFGMQFFFAQLFFMGILSTNELFITRLFSASDVVDYSIYNKLFTVIGSIFMLALTPLWSKITKDFTEKKYEQIKKTNQVLYLIALIAFIAELLLVPFLQFVVDIWLRKETIAVNYGTALVFACFGGVYIFNVVLTTVANGIGELKTQIAFYGVGALLKIPICMLMKSVANVWVIIVLYNLLILTAFCVYQYFWVNKKISKLILQGEGNYVI